MKSVILVFVLVTAPMFAAHADPILLNMSGTYVGAGGPNPERDVVNGLSVSGYQQFGDGSPGGMLWNGVLTAVNPYSATLTGSGTYTWFDSNNTMYRSSFELSYGGVYMDGSIDTLYWGAAGPFGGIGGVTTQQMDYPTVIQNAIQTARRQNPNESDVFTARTALGIIVGQRDEPGKSTDVPLRDAEYALRNWIGAKVATGSGEGLSIGDYFVDAGFQNPGATAAYNATKWLADALGYGSWNRANPNNPNSDPGGFTPAYTAYWAGITGKTLDETFQPGGVAIPPPGSPGSSLQNPLTPVALPSNINSATSIFLSPVQQDIPLFLDPPLGGGIEYQVAPGSPQIVSIKVPAGQTSQFPLGFTLIVPGHDPIHLAPGQKFEFATLGFTGGVNDFDLIPVQQLTTAELFVLELEMSGAGMMALSEAYLDSEIPEPESLFLVTISLLALASCRRPRPQAERKRSTQPPREAA
jgi:hypothetical protein